MKKFNAIRQQWIRWTVAVALAALFVPVLPLIASQKKRTHPVRKSTAHQRRRRVRRTRRYARVRLQPARVRQIQEALIKAGFLHDKPDGVWGSSTREAMRAYQKQNGFTPTGLPEAKPLMKLGLGPHPLPPELDPVPPGNAESQGEAESAAATTSPTARRPSASKR